MDVDSAGNLYVEAGNSLVSKFDSSGVFQYTVPGGGESGSLATDEVNGDLYVVTGGVVKQYTPSGNSVGEFGSGLGGASSIAVNGVNGKVYVGTRSSPGTPALDRVDIFDLAGTPVTLPDPATGDASDFQPTEVTLHGTIDPHGIDTNDCHFEWSTNTSFGNSADCIAGKVVSGNGQQDVSAVATGLNAGTSYSYRLVTGNIDGSVVGRQDRKFVPSASPAIDNQFASDPHGDGFTVHADINPGGANTRYHVEYGPAPCSTIACTPSANSGDAGSGVGVADRNLVVSGLAPGTTYYYRMVATNQSGTTYGADDKITTFPYSAVLTDSCANAHVRQQTGAALLPDCRAYELVSARDTGGYDVESDLVGGQHPFSGFPRAEGRALYGVHSGAIPGPWNPTNRGVDPYLSTRGATGWSTTYVGIPADAPSDNPFSSTLAGVDPGLNTFVFAGLGDLRSLLWRRLVGDAIVDTRRRLFLQGMVGSEAVADPTPAGEIKKPFSADGSHFVFGSEQKFEPSGNDENGNVTIYDRDLETGVTQVVSTMPDASTIEAGDEVAELGLQGRLPDSRRDAGRRRCRRKQAVASLSAPRDESQRL